VRDARLDESAFLLVQHVLDERGLELADRRGGLFVLRDPAAHAHEVGERPV